METKKCEIRTTKTNVQCQFSKHPKPNPIDQEVTEEQNKENHSPHVCVLRQEDRLHQKSYEKKFKL